MHKPNPLVKRAELSSAYFTLQPPLCLCKVPLPPVGSLLLSSVVNEELQKGQMGQSHNNRHLNSPDEARLYYSHENVQHAG